MEDHLEFAEFVREFTDPHPTSSTAREIADTAPHGLNANEPAGGQVLIEDMINDPHLLHSFG
jgi:hypothetical protein